MKLASQKDFLSGLMFTIVGASFALGAREYEVGGAARMGPGYFPLLLALVLALLGVVILVQATRVKGEPVGPIAWRGMLLILPAPVLFGLTVRGLGFVPAVFLTALFASFASVRMRLLPALVLSAAVTLFSYLVFSLGLGLPFRSFGPWLSF